MSHLLLIFFAFLHLFVYIILDVYYCSLRLIIIFPVAGTAGRSELLHASSLGRQPHLPLEQTVLFGIALQHRHALTLFQPCLHGSHFQGALLIDMTMFTDSCTSKLNHFLKKLFLNQWWNIHIIALKILFRWENRVDCCISSMTDFQRFHFSVS